MSRDAGVLQCGYIVAGAPVRSASVPGRASAVRRRPLGDGGDSDRRGGGGGGGGCERGQGQWQSADRGTRAAAGPLTTDHSYSANDI